MWPALCITRRGLHRRSTRELDVRWKECVRGHSIAHSATIKRYSRHSSTIVQEFIHFCTSLCPPLPRWRHDSKLVHIYLEQADNCTTSFHLLIHCTIQITETSMTLKSVEPMNFRILNWSGSSEFISSNILHRSFFFHLSISSQSEHYPQTE